MPDLELDHSRVFWREMEQRAGLPDEQVAEQLALAVMYPWKPLGAVLIRNGYLSVRDVAYLLRLHADEPETRLGDLAVREGLCGRDQIEEAVALQAREHPSPALRLAQDPSIDKEKLCLALAAYVQHLEGSLQSMGALV